MAEDIDKALEQCERLLEMLEDVPDKADFKEPSVEFVESVKEQIETREFVTTKQVERLDRIEQGAERWLGRDRERGWF